MSEDSENKVESRQGGRWLTSIMTVPKSRGGQVLVVTVLGAGRYRYQLFARVQERVTLLHEIEDPGEGLDVPAALRAAGHRLGADLDVVLVLPRRHVLVKHIQLPTQDPKQISRMVPYEAYSHSPWPREQTLFAHEVTGGMATGQSLLTLYLARMDWVEQCLEKLGQHNVFPLRVEVSTRALESLLRASDSGPASSMLLVESGETEYVRVSASGGVFSRAANVLEESPRETFLRARQIDQRERAGVALEDAFVVAGCELALFSDLPEASAPASLSALEAFGRNGELDCTPLRPGLVVGVGVLLLSRTPLDSFNLMPSGYLRWLEPRRLLRRARTTGFLVLWCVALIAGLGYYQYREQASRADRARESIAALGADVGDLEAKSDALRLLRSERDKVRLPLNIFLEIYGVTPPRIAINSMRLETDGDLVLGCEAPDFATSFEYLDALGASDHMARVEFVSGSRPQRSRDGLVEFKVKCDLAPHGTGVRKGAGR